MAASLGAHETMEIHEVLNCEINTINEMQLLHPLIRDPNLHRIMDSQLTFMTQEYNNMVALLQNRGMSGLGHGMNQGMNPGMNPAMNPGMNQGMNPGMSGQMMSHGVPYRTPKNMAPVYGLDNPGKESPNMAGERLDDRDISSMMLGCHKTGAVSKMRAALECADPHIRRMMQQGAINCAEQAYEVWQYMNQQGYYQVPTMKEMTTQTLMNTYEPGSMNIHQPVGVPQ